MVRAPECSSYSGRQAASTCWCAWGASTRPYRQGGEAAPPPREGLPEGAPRPPRGGCARAPRRAPPPSGPPASHPPAWRGHGRRDPSDHHGDHRKQRSDGWDSSSIASGTKLGVPGCFRVRTATGDRNRRKRKRRLPTRGQAKLRGTRETACARPVLRSAHEPDFFASASSLRWERGSALAGEAILLCELPLSP